MSERIISPKLSDEDTSYEPSLRPKWLRDYIGQEKNKANLHVFVEAAKARKEALDHVIFYGPPGLGKTTLAYIIANEMEVQIKTTTGPALDKAGDLAAIISNLQDHDVLFIDEIHRLNPLVEETLYPAMEEFHLDIIIGQGPSARSIKLDLPKFTLVGATTRTGLLTSPLRDRFGIVVRLDFYQAQELQSIVLRAALLMKIEVDPEGATEIAMRSRGTPRIANRLLRRVRDFAQVEGDGMVTKKTAKEALERLDVDERGFDAMDKTILLTLIEKFDGGPVGIDTISAAVSEQKDTIEDVYEPFLIQSGFIKRTPRGRVVTRLAYEHLGKKKSREKQGNLF